MELITSLQNERVKRAAKLRDGGTRRKEGKFLIDGVREIRRARQGAVSILEAYYCPEQCTLAAAEETLSELRAHGAACVAVSAPVLAKLAFGQRCEGLVAVAETPRRTLAEIKLPELPLVAILEGVEKPGNVGAVLRSADGAGVSAVVVADGGTDLYNPNAIRASLGTIFTQPVCAASRGETQAWLKRFHLPVFAARVDGAVPYTAVDFRRPCALVLGSEAAGLSGVWQGANVTAISLPLLGTADSLNVSTTAAVLFYEALRQRQGK